MTYVPVPVSMPVPGGSALVVLVRRFRWWEPEELTTW